jgi:2-polyprenyl-3-methyl-5-hydroxy-6-metoxy-1,4-benzoquinol methylase
LSADPESWRLTLAPEEFSRVRAPLIAVECVPFCPICRSSEHTELAVGFDYELLTCSNPWRFVQCGTCGHVWLNPRPGVAELGVIYPSTYYAYNYAKINPLARKAKDWLDRRKMAKIIRQCGAPPRTYADIGCGDGRFLRTLEKLGVVRSGLYGLELDEQVVNRLRSEGYTGVFCERVEDTSSLPEGAIDLITMFHVIEHVNDPAAVVRQVARWLSPGGVFALETPNLGSLDARLFQRTYWGGYHIPRHWNLFTPTTISRLLKENGLEVVTTIFQTGHSFWMYSLHHWVRFEGASRPRAGAWFDPMKSLCGIAGFTAFDLFRGALGAQTSAMLVICRKTPHSPTAPSAGSD